MCDNGGRNIESLHFIVRVFWLIQSLYQEMSRNDPDSPTIDPR